MVHARQLGSNREVRTPTWKCLTSDARLPVKNHGCPEDVWHILWLTAEHDAALFNVYFGKTA